MIFDHAIILWLQQIFSSSFGHAIGIFCSRYLIFVLIGFWLVMLWTARHDHDKKHRLIEIFWAGILAFCLAALLGNLVDRTRPFLAHADIERWIPTPLSDTSFPSRHASIAFAVAAGICLVDSWFGVLALIIAILIAFGRVVTGVHYPSDVLAGAIVGIVSMIAVRYLHHAIRKRDLKTKP